MPSKAKRGDAELAQAPGHRDRTGARALIGAAGLWLGLCTALPSAQARQHADYAYPLSRVWMSAVRLLRVDYSAPIVEKDKEDGYFLFEYSYQGKAYPGSVEVVPGIEDGRRAVRVVIQLSDMPTYVERMMLDRLRRKLEADFGPPPAQKPPSEDHKEEEKPEDDGAEPPEKPAEGDPD